MSNRFDSIESPVCIMVSSLLSLPREFHYSSPSDCSVRILFPFQDSAYFNRFLDLLSEDYNGDVHHYLNGDEIPPYSFYSVLFSHDDFVSLCNDANALLNLYSFYHA